jgi:hypothetical protein
MITEKQIKEFEQKAKDDALQAFNNMLSSYQEQVRHFSEIKSNVDKQKKVLSQWADEAHYRIDWNKYTATHHHTIGKCKRCGTENIGLLKYNDDYLVCESCFDRLSDEFDDEYK